MSYKNIIFEKANKIGVITFNRPEVMNAFNTEMLHELIALFEEIKEDDDVRVIVFRGAGDRAFSAGADIFEIANNGPIEQEAYNRLWIKFFQMIEGIRKPVIASVHGFAPGGGTELSLCCDMVIASDDAKLGLAEIKLGVIPGAGATVRLPRWVGKAKAMEMLMTGDLISGEEAERIGLINRVVPREKLWDETTALANKLAEKAPLALAAAKASINIGAELDRDRGVEYAFKEFLLLFATEDKQEAVRAFAEKRKPVWKGR